MEPPAHPGFRPAQTVVLVGGSSRSGSTWLASLDEKTRAEYLGVRAVRASRWTEAIREAVGMGAECVAVAGGDGTLRRAADLVARAGLVLGVVPTGTGNAFATEVGVQVDPQNALKSLSKPGAVRQVDLGECNEEPFVNAASLGLGSEITRALRDLPKGSVGKWAYLPALVRAYEQARPFNLRVEGGGERFEGSAIQAVFSVSRFHGGPFRATPGAAHDDGLVSAYVVEASDRSALLLYGSALLVGRHTELPSVWSHDAPRFEVDPSRPQRFVLDGDRFSFRRATISVLPGALRVFVPTS